MAQTTCLALFGRVFVNAMLSNPPCTSKISIIPINISKTQKRKKYLVVEGGRGMAAVDVESNKHKLEVTCKRGKIPVCM